jgi:thioesterase domain-containing protein
MRDNGITVAHLTPAMAQVLDQTAKQPVPSVRRVFFAGDLLTLRDVEKTRRLMPAAEIVNFYASSESQRASGYKIFAGETDNKGKEIPPLGRGVKDVQLLVANPHGHLAGVGELGEIWVRSPHMARGYLNDENLTAERFIVNPFTGKTDDRVFRTGERGRFLPDGEVEFGGRLENQVSIRGFRVELSEIESALGRHSEVREVVVVAHEAPGEDVRLAAYVVPKREPAPTTSDLRGFLKQKLPEYMLPSAFVLMTNLPLTPNGKVDHAALPAVSQQRPELQNHYVAPRSRAEKILAEIWAEILNLERVGVHDNFFDLGGHSILAVRLAAEVERRFLKNVPAAMPFQAPTIAHMAKALFQARGPAPSPLMAIQTIGTKPPFFCVHGVEAYVALSRQLGADQPFYGLSQDFAGRSIRYTRIEEIAAHYIAEMKRIQSSGPYFLGGHSIGGMIAFEMAQQLRRQGAEVALLALFDTRHPDAFRESPMDSGGKGKRLYQRVFEIVKPRKIIQTVPARVAQGAKTIACHTYQLFGMPLPVQLQNFYLDEMIHRRLYDKALARYQPGPYGGRVALFLPIQKQDRWNHWQTAVGNANDVHWLPGDQIDLTSETNIRMLADQLKVYLNKAQAAPGPFPSTPIH